MTEPANTPDLLLELVHKMQSAASSYIEPATYFQCSPGGDSDYDRQVRMPAWNQSEDTVRAIEAKRSAMFIGDIIYMLDGPEQRAAEAAHTRPQPATASPVTVKPLVLEVTLEDIMYEHLVADRGEVGGIADAIKAILSAIQPEATGAREAALREAKDAIGKVNVPIGSTAIIWAAQDAIEALIDTPAPAPQTVQEAARVRDLNDLLMRHMPLKQMTINAIDTGLRAAEIVEGVKLMHGDYLALVDAATSHLRALSDTPAHSKPQG